MEIIPYSGFASQSGLSGAFGRLSFPKQHQSLQSSHGHLSWHRQKSSCLGTLAPCPTLCQWEVHGRSHIRQAGGQSHTHWPHTGCWGREGASPLISDCCGKPKHGGQVREAWIPQCAPEDPEGFWVRLQQDRWTLLGHKLFAWEHISPGTP